MKIKLSQKRSEEIKKFIKKLDLGKEYEKQLIVNEFKNLLIINEALTHSSANNKVNYENLEFLGDAVLRLIASDFIKDQYPKMKVGERSELRSHLVSDQWLEGIGEKININKILLIGPKALGDLSAKSTIKAEATEALIGALYVSLSELNPIKSWLVPYWEEKSKEVLADPYKQNYKSALQEWSQGRGFPVPKYKTAEKHTEHAQPNRFFCTVHIKDKSIAEGWGCSIKRAEKQAAMNALKFLEKDEKNIKPI